MPKLNKKDWLPLLVILAGALAIRLVFFTGMVRGDALNYAHAAYELVQGRSPFGVWVGATRIGLVLPVAGLYALFGANQVTTLLFPMAASLASVVFVFLIARMFSNQAGGLIAALLWAFLPLDVHLSTSLLPDSIVASLSTGVAYFLFLGERSNGRAKRTAYGLCSLLLIWAILVKPIAIVIVIFLGGYSLVRFLERKGPAIRSWWRGAEMGKRRALLMAGGLVLLAAGLAYAAIQVNPFIVTLANTATDISSLAFTGATDIDFSSTRVSNSSLLVYLAPLVLIVAVQLFAKRRQELQPVLLWTFALFLYVEWGTFALNPSHYGPFFYFLEARNYVFLMAPFVVLIAIYLTDFVAGKRSEWFLALMGLPFPLLAYLLKGQIYAGEIPTWLGFMPLLLIVGSLALPAIKQGGAVWALGLLVVTLLTFLIPADPYHAAWYADRVEFADTLRTSQRFWAEHPTGQILVESKNVAMSLNYASDFSLGFDWSGAGDSESNLRIQIGQKPVQSDARVFLLWMEAGDPPGSGWQLEQRYASKYEAPLSIFSRSGTK